jgi:hypothetical protein
MGRTAPGGGPLCDLEDFVIFRSPCRIGVGRSLILREAETAQIIRSACHRFRFSAGAEVRSASDQTALVVRPYGYSPDEADDPWKEVHRPDPQCDREVDG